MRDGYISICKCDISGHIAGWAAILLLILASLPPGNAYAAESENTDTAASIEDTVEDMEDFQPWVGAPEIPYSELPSKPKFVPGIIEKLEVQRDYYSEKIVAFTKSVDQFFGDPRYFQENNKSVIQLNFNQSIAQGGSRPFAFEGQARLDLPAASRRFQFVFEANPEKKSVGEVTRDQPEAPTETAKPTQYAASLRYEEVEESLWHFSSEAGAKLQFPIDPFVRTRGSYAIQMEEWRLKLAESVFWFSTIGLGETTQLDMERVLSTSLLFRATSTATCMEKPQNCDLRQDFAYYHTLDERSAVVYQASVIGVTHPVKQETAYVLLSRYRHRLYKEWVFFEITPQLNFPRTEDFRLNASLLLRLEMLFGATK